MATPRSPGGSPSIRRPSSHTSPESALSRPAMMRSKVDLPDPDGPRNAMNSRASSVRLTSSSTGVAPKLFRTPLSCRLATRLSPSGVRLYRSWCPPQRASASRRPAGLARLRRAELKSVEQGHVGSGDFEIDVGVFLDTCRVRRFRQRRDVLLEHVANT